MSDAKSKKPTRQTTKQVSKGAVRREPNGKLKKGSVINPAGKGGFKENPQNRSDGGWKKEMVFSYQYKRFMNMTLDELKKYAATPENERTVVEDLAYNRVVAAKESLPDIKEITDRTEGRAPQSLNIKDDRPDPIAAVLRRFELLDEEGEENDAGETPRIASPSP